jgi:acyl-CoA thioester hydrolase
LHQGGLVFVVRRMAIEFLRPGHMDDVLKIVTRPGDIRGASLVLSQEVWRGDALLVTAEVVVAAVRHGRAVRMPNELRSALSLHWEPS